MSEFTEAITAGLSRPAILAAIRRFEQAETMIGLAADAQSLADESFRVYMRGGSELTAKRDQRIANEADASAIRAYNAAVASLPAPFRREVGSADETDSFQMLREAIYFVHKELSRADSALRLEQ